MESKLVSIVIPTYNRAEYLREAIESVLSQTYIHFELLILDNCSTDNTQEIVATFNDPRIKYIRHVCNIRLLANWAYGIHWAKGEYLAILGDDDIYNPTFISSRVKAFSTYEGIVAVFSNYELINSKGEIQRTHPYSFDFDCVLSGKKLVRLAVISGWFLGSTLYNREIVQQLLEKSIMAGLALDTSLNINIAISGKKVAWIKDKGLTYRMHENQVSGSRLVLIGHVAACSLPLMLEECRGYRNILAKGSIWALKILGRNALSDRRYKMERRFVKMELSANIWSLNAWAKLLLEFHPTNRKAFNVETKQIFEFLQKIDYSIMTLNFELLSTEKFDNYQEIFMENYILLPNSTLKSFSKQ